MRLLLRCSIIVIIVFLSESCSIQKRQHRSGWHVSWNANYNSYEKDKDTFKLGSTSIKAIADKSNYRQKKQNEGQDALQLKSIQTNKMSPKNQTKERLNTIHNSGIGSVDCTLNPGKEIKGQLKLEENSFSLSKLEPHKEKRTQWLPRLLGGFFGVILGIVALVPLFFIVCLFFVTEGKVSNLTFKEKDSDGPMTRSFKKTYHAIFRVGLLLMILILIFGASALLIFIAYVALEIVGIILAIILVLLILLLFIKIWKGLLDFLMFE